MRKRTWAAMVCAAVVAGAVLAGCSSGTGTAGPESPAAAEGTAPSVTEGAEAEAENSEGVSRETESGGKPGTGLTSQEYVEAMGHGWNLGNSFDGVNTDETEADAGETAWGNPEVTRELIHAVKEKGFSSIRIPMTLFRRYEEEDGIWVIDQEWLARYKEVIDWAVDEGLYVMANIHHDSWIWLKDWDGDPSSEEYVRFVKLWEQLADYLKEEPEQVCFETINEPDFVGDSDEEKQEKLDAINRAAYEAIRASGGGNATRMIVMPTLWTNYEKCDPLLKLIQDLEDDHLIATVHYYSEWVYSSNLGIT